MHIEFYTGFPPSTNTYYAHTSMGVRIAAKGRAYRKRVIDDINEQLMGAKASGRCLVEVVLWPPCNRTRDMDNFNKALLDAITHADLWEDDGVVDQLFIYRGTVSKGHGVAGIRITEAGPLMPIGHMPPMD